MSAAIVVPHQITSLDVAQHALCAQMLGDAEPLLEGLLLRLRAEVDAELAPRFPSFAGKPWPLGRCREIRDAVFDRLQALLRQAGRADDDRGLKVLRHYLQAGGICHKVWGSLRDEYFQNALQLGAWYVDIANDTVVATKPKLEILPMERSGFSNIRDYEKFAAIARRYWQVEVCANTVLPKLAPLLPLICVKEGRNAWLAPAYDEMIELTRASQFFLSERIVAALPPAPLRVRRMLATLAAACSPNSVDLELLALDGDPRAACIEARQAGLMHSGEYRQRVVSTFKALRRAGQSRSVSGVQ